MRFLAILSLVLLFIVIPATIMIFNYSGSPPEHGAIAQPTAGSGQGTTPSSLPSSSQTGNQANVEHSGAAVEPGGETGPHAFTYERRSPTYFEILRNELMLVAVIILAIMIDRWFFRGNRRRYRRR